MRYIFGVTLALEAFNYGATADLGATAVELVPNACTSDMPTGLGPSVTPDTAAAFLAYTYFSSNATAATSVSGYTIVASDQQAWAEATTTTSMGWLNLPTYDVGACGTYCTNTLGCLAFDIFYQRSPTISPSFNTSCPNPPSMTSIMCWIYSTAMTTADMINSGETRGQFQVVIAGSNLFNKGAAP